MAAREQRERGTVGQGTGEAGLDGLGRDGAVVRDLGEVLGLSGVAVEGVAELVWMESGGSSAGRDRAKVRGSGLTEL